LHVKRVRIGHVQLLLNLSCQESRSFQVIRRRERLPQSFSYRVVVHSQNNFFIFFHLSSLLFFISLLLSRDEDDKETEEQQTTRRERKKTSTPSAYSSHDANDDDKDDEEEDNLFLLFASISGACGGFIFARAVYKWVYFYVSWEQLLDTK